MIINRRSTNKIIVILFFVLVGLNGLAGAAELTILQETAAGLTVRIKIDAPFEWRQIENYPEKISSLTLGDAYQAYLRKDLEIPYYEWLIALPKAIRPAITVTKSVYETVKLEKNLASDDLSAMAKYPLAQMTGIGYMRDVPSGSLEIYPLRPGDRPGELKLLREIEVMIPYAATGTLQSSPREIGKSEFLNAFVNVPSAAQWRQPRSLNLKKAQAQVSGKWLKITVEEDDVYILTLADLKSAGITENSIDTSRIFLYSNSSGGRELDETIGAAVPANLVENARLISGNGDGYFTTADTIIFYGRATSGLTTDSQGALIFERNCYSFDNYYWLFIADTPGSPKAMSRIPSLSETSVKTVTETDRLEVHEFESANFLRGGKSWYGEKFPSSGSNVTVLLNLPATKTSYPAKLTIKTRGATSEGQLFHNFSLYLNSATSPVTRWSCTNFSSLARYFTTTLQPGINILRINYTSSLNTASAYLDYVKCLYMADLESFTTPQIFWSPLYDGTVEYQITDLGIANPIIMDISDWSNVTLQQFNQSAKTIKFQAVASSTQRNQYFLYSPADYKKPENIKLIENPEWAKLRDPANDYDYIIITHESLLPAAEKIATLYSQEVPADDRLKTIVVTQNQILREFNADINDPHAIRYFLKYAYENWVTAPAYVMILGDGTFDYRGIESSQGNLVMTYQVETISDTDYSTDARFVYISGSDKIMDMAVGRITVRTLSEAQDYYEKLRQYLLEPKYGEWRSRITLMADDPVRPWNNEPGHTTDSESYIARYIPKSLMTNKLYLLEYPEVQDATSYGVKKPAATQALMDQLKRGTTIINYLGHGSPTVWAQEYVLYMDRDIGLIDTDGQLPFWIAGTCSWGQFDDINSTCMPEALIARTDDGGIAALAATRPTYGSPNASFISSMLQKLFPGGRIARVRLGTLLQMTLNGQDENNEKYILFGDPALYLALPYQKAEFDKMPSDTLSALKNVAITGRAKDANPDFNGAGIINVFDSDQYVTRYYLTGAGVSSSLSYTLPGEVLFRGNLNIASGAFTSSFFIPKDLNYQNLFGRIKLYGWDNTSGSELSGCYDSLKFTGNSVEIDTIGPAIKIGFEDMNFVTGDIVTSTKKLEIKIEDEHGINIAGQLGHDISVQFDEDKDLLYKMTTDFVYDTDSDSSGTILSALPDLSAGVHQISVKAWDNANNYTTATADFTLTSSEKLHLEKVVNYPNPFSDETDFVFFLTQAGQVKITVYTIRGLRIKTIDGNEILLAGFHQINWDGRDDFGDEIARGIYIYKIQVQSSELDQKDSYIGKMVKS